MTSNPYAEYTPPASDGGLYHKFEDGVTYIVRLTTEPVVYQTEYTDGNLSTKYAWVIWNNESKAAQVMQLPVTAYRQIASFAVDEDYGDPTGYNLKITRTGKGLDTKYEVIPSPKKTDLDAEAKEACAQIDLKNAISSGKGVSNVFWLSEASAPKKEKTSHKAVADVMNEDMDKPVDLSEIPF